MTHPLTLQPAKEQRSARFFAAYESNANTCDFDAMTPQFAQTFLAAGPQGSQAVRREDFLAFLPKRQQILTAMGLRGATLSSLKETSVGPAHLLAETEWEITTDSSGAEGNGDDRLRVSSTFLLERAGESWRIVFYLAHDDLAALMRERHRKAADRAASDCPLPESKVC